MWLFHFNLISQRDFRTRSTTELSREIGRCLTEQKNNVWCLGLVGLAGCSWILYFPVALDEFHAHLYVAVSLHCQMYEDYMIIYIYIYKLYERRGLPISVTLATLNVLASEWNRSEMSNNVYITHESRMIFIFTVEEIHEYFIDVLCLVFFLLCKWDNQQKSCKLSHCKTAEAFIKALSLKLCVPM